MTVEGNPSYQKKKDKRVLAPIKERVNSLRLDIRENHTEELPLNIVPDFEEKTPKEREAIADEILARNHRAFSDAIMLPVHTKEFMEGLVAIRGMYRNDVLVTNDPEVSERVQGNVDYIDKFLGRLAIYEPQNLVESVIIEPRYLDEAA